MFITLSISFWLFVGYGIHGEVWSWTFMVTLLLFLVSCGIILLTIRNAQRVNKGKNHVVGIEVIPYGARLWGGVIFFCSYLGYAWIKVLCADSFFSWRYGALSAATLIFLLLLVFLLIKYKKRGRCEEK